MRTRLTRSGSERNVKRTVCRLVLVVGALALAATTVSAQGAPAGAGGKPGKAWLLFDKRVQEELKLTPEQIAKVHKVPSDVETAHKEEGEKLIKRYTELATRENELNLLEYAEVKKAVADFLKPEQIQRLGQIEVRLLGISAFEDPLVRNTLVLTDKQVAQFKAMREKAQKELNAFGEKEQKEAGQDRTKQQQAYLRVQQKQAAMGKETMDNILAGLSEQQRKTWKELLGPPPSAALANDNALLFGAKGGLYFAEVRDEVGVTKEQKSKLDTVINQVSDRHKADTQKLREEQSACMQQMKSLNGTLDQEADQVLAKMLPNLLSPEQLKRLNQISVQVRNFFALGDADVQAELKFTEAQKKDVKAILEQYEKDLQTVQLGAFKEAGQDAKKFNEILPRTRGALDQETIDKLTGKLSAEQKKAWQDLRGAPFDLKGSGTFTGPQPQKKD
jgi:hypothetical protein